MTVTMPYFMTNKEWYYYDEEEYWWKLTDKAPVEAVKSYKEYYETVNLFITFDEFDNKQTNCNKDSWR